jgi:hypothetical protein
MIDLPIPPTYCETKQEFAEIIMTHVNSADLGKIAESYKAHGKDRHRKVLKAALDNFRMKGPLTVSEFGIKIYKECINE